MIPCLLISFYIYSDPEEKIVAVYSGRHDEGRVIWVLCLLMTLPNIFNSYELLLEHWESIEDNQGFIDEIKG